MFFNYFVYLGTIFIINSTNYIQKATQNPSSKSDLYNAATELYLSDKNEDAEFFFKLVVSNNSDDKIKEKGLINYANSLIKQERFQEALDLSNVLKNDFNNSQAEHNIPILEEILRQKELQDKQQDQQDNQDQRKDQEQDKQNNQEQNKDQNQKNSQNQQDKDNNPDDSHNKRNQQKQKENERLKKNQDKKKVNQAGKENINKKSTDKLEHLLESISEFDQEMMKLYAQSECNKNDSLGKTDEGW